LGAGEQEERAATLPAKGAECVCDAKALMAEVFDAVVALTILVLIAGIVPNLECFLHCIER